MVDNPDINCLIKMFRYYKHLADSCWGLYDDILDAYLVYDHYMIYVQIYETEILEQLI